VTSWFNNLNNLAALLEIVAALVGGGAWLLVQLRKFVRGRPERRYTRWFLDQYSTYWNPYLDKTERLRLDRTYIPLSFEDGPTQPSSLVSATTTVANRSVGKIVVLGGAGSGKTTMLKAYGVSALIGDARLGRVAREVPFFGPTDSSVGGFGAFKRCRAVDFEGCLISVGGWRSGAPRRCPGAGPCLPRTAGRRGRRGRRGLRGQGRPPAAAQRSRKRPLRPAGAAP
jgi:hypothetical protein